MSESITKMGHLALSQETVEMEFKTEGYSPFDLLRVNLGPAKCGDIDDGITLQHDSEGSWVLSFKDLALICDAAKKVRGIR